ncbi:MAG: endonuclease MutS2 [Oscillospiraceae bacterium]|nr:endonuclease MutS2 [Oscillospiraceae bacterium]
MYQAENQKHLSCLELDAVLKAVSEEAGIEESRQKILELKPHYDFDAALSALNKTKDAYELAAKFGSPHFSGVKNVNSALKRAKNGGNLSLLELLQIAEVLRNVRGLCQYREQFSSVETTLDDYFNSLFPNKYFEEKIFTCIVSEDTVADSASKELADIRRSIRRENQQIREKLDKLIRSQSHQKHLQDSIVTQRDGRFVIPVKQEYRGEIEGLVHDTSSSGATIFIEPTAVVEANNRIRILEAKERDEILRIIAELSSEAGTFAESIELSYEAMIEIDIRFAMANYAYKTKASLPLLNDKGITELKKARHPLIDRDKVVPIDIRLGKDFSVLVITGPNTGGKTVALKTLGLLSLMAMCGLFIPAQDESTVSVYDSVYADIGDEQSIEQSLSTFSSHMVNIIDIIRNADKKSLVLLDEVGAGTDPIEGAALAVSIIEKLKYLGAKTAATTHYAEMKMFALETDGVENASCEFDVASLKPTYKLLIGVPGKSNAFAISQKLGLQTDIIENAKGLISAEDRRFENMLENLEKSRREAESERARLDALLRENEELNKILREKNDKNIKASEQIIDDARQQAKSLVDEISRKSEEILRELEELKSKKDKKEFSSRLSDAKGRLRSDIRRLENEADPIVRRKKKDYRLPRDLIAGDNVRLADIDKEGIVITPPDAQGNALVRVGIMKMRVNISNLILIDKKVEPLKKIKVNGESRATREIKTELDIRGYDTVEGVMELDQFIDSAIMTGLGSVTVIHGKGTGALKNAVWQRLKSNKNVKSFRSGTFGEGEMGVTVIELK